MMEKFTRKKNKLKFCREEIGKIRKIVQNHIQKLNKRVLWIFVVVKLKKIFFLLQVNAFLNTVFLKFL